MKFEKLEAIRGLAAIYVVAGHVFGHESIKAIVPAIVRFPFRFGQEAVMAFFLLSGFVIYISVSRSTTIDFPRYFLKRFVRIYPILIATFIISAIVAIIDHHDFVIEDVRTLLGNLFMLQDLDGKPGFIVDPFLRNWPLWTLGYECGFYLMFYPVYIFFVKEKTIKLSSTYVVLFMSMIGWLLYMIFPHHIFLVLSYFSLWWTGVACAQIYLEHKTFTFKVLKPALLSLAVMTIISFIPFGLALVGLGEPGRILYPMEYPIVTFRHYFMSMVFVLVGLAWWKAKLKGFQILFGWGGGVFASISYGLYVSHHIFINLNLPGINNVFVAMALRLTLAFITAYLLEIKMQPVFNKWLLKR